MPEVMQPGYDPLTEELIRRGLRSNFGTLRAEPIDPAILREGLEKGIIQQPDIPAGGYPSAPQAAPAPQPQPQPQPQLQQQTAGPPPTGGEGWGWKEILAGGGSLAALALLRRMGAKDVPTPTPPVRGAHATAPSAKAASKKFSHPSQHASGGGTKKPATPAGKNGAKSPANPKGKSTASRTPPNAAGLRETFPVTRSLGQVVPAEARAADDVLDLNTELVEPGSVVDALAARARNITPGAPSPLGPPTLTRTDIPTPPLGEVQQPLIGARGMPEMEVPRPALKQFPPAQDVMVQTPPMDTATDLGTQELIRAIMSSEGLMRSRAKSGRTTARRGKTGGSTESYKKQSDPEAAAFNQVTAAIREAKNPTPKDHKPDYFWRKEEPKRDKRKSRKPKRVSKAEQKKRDAVAEALANRKKPKPKVATARKGTRTPRSKIGTGRIMKEHF